MNSADREILTKNLLSRYGSWAIGFVHRLVDVAERRGYRGACVAWALESIQQTPCDQDPEMYSDDDLGWILRSADYNLSPHRYLNDAGDLVIVPDAMTDRNDSLGSGYYDDCGNGIVCYPVYRDDGTQNGEDAYEF